MDLYNLGPVSWWESQCFYHALAQTGREGIIICYPTSPYVCLGLHDDFEQEIDFQYCLDQGLPVFRRETGGGTVYLDDKQLFYQVVLRRDNPLVALNRLRFYKAFLQPAISVYRLFGVPAQLKSPADIIAEGRKCSGNAAGDIGQCVAYVGNFLLDFDFEAMSKVLRLPNVIFRKYFLQAMKANMTTLKDWAQEPITHEQLIKAYIEELGQLFNNLCPRTVDEELLTAVLEVKKHLTDEDWLTLSGRRYSERRVKVAEGVFLIEKQVEEKGTAIVLLRDGIEYKLEDNISDERLDKNESRTISASRRLIL